MFIVYRHLAGFEQRQEEASRKKTIIEDLRLRRRDERRKISRILQEESRKSRIRRMLISNSWENSQSGRSEWKLSL